MKKTKLYINIDVLLKEVSYFIYFFQIESDFSCNKIDVILMYKMAY